MDRDVIQRLAGFLHQVDFVRFGADPGAHGRGVDVQDEQQQLAGQVKFEQRRKRGVIAPVVEQNLHAGQGLWRRLRAVLHDQQQLSVQVAAVIREVLQGAAAWLYDHAFLLGHAR